MSRQACILTIFNPYSAEVVLYKSWRPNGYSPRARGVLFVLKGPYDLRVPPIVKFSQESESARLKKIILSKSTVKNL